jgi:hypothetical protein
MYCTVCSYDLWALVAQFIFAVYSLFANNLLVFKKRIMLFNPDFTTMLWIYYLQRGQKPRTHYANSPQSSPFHL